MALRKIGNPVLSDRLVHRVERMPAWRITDNAQPWRALCGVPVGRVDAGGVFEFEVAVALDPEAWRLAANCSSCLAVTERRSLGTIS